MSNENVIEDKSTSAPAGGGISTNELGAEQVGRDVPTLANTGAEISLGKLLLLVFNCCCRAFLAAYKTTKYSALSGKLEIESTSLAVIEG